VVAGGAHHRAELAAAEQVLLGRSGDTPGRWSGTTRIERAGTPLLHTTVDLGPGARAWLPPATLRAYASTVRIGEEAPTATEDGAVRLPLPGGWVATGWGDALHTVAAGVARLGLPGLGATA
jgi:urease accessory protein